MLTNKTRYALKALIALAAQQDKGTVSIADISEKEGIPRKFLELILLEMKNLGILQSKRGKAGGYALAKSPDSITLGYVVRVLEGPLAPVPCVSQTAYRKCDDCLDEQVCGLRLIMKDVRDAVASILDSTTLADVLKRMAESAAETRKAPMYYI
jgi:Rrf2 family protein